VAGALLYLDSSALVKLVVPEPESRALREALRSWPERVSSVVAEIEVERVGGRLGSGAIRRARSVLARVALIELDEEVRRRVAGPGPAELGTVDAIHLATALTLGNDLGAPCAYDTRLVDAPPPQAWMWCYLTETAVPWRSSSWGRQETSVTW
jgi:hypothetical protein